MATFQTGSVAYQLPEGVKDRLPREAARLNRLLAILADVFHRWGYREVMTPAFELLETVTAGQARPARQEDYYQFFDRRGRTLALRPDMTAPIARLAAARLAAEPPPLRYSYRGPVFRHRGQHYGALHEVWQAGVEMIGAGGPPADAEIIALACETLAAAGLTGFKVGVGHVAVVEGVLASAGVSGPEAATFREALAARDLVACERLAAQAADPTGARLLVDLAGFAGDHAAAVQRFGSLGDKGVARALAEVGQTLDLLASYGVDGQVALDLGLARSFGYYTGIVFEGYAPGVGAPVLGGGRYDGLLAAFAGTPVPATGLALDLDRVLQALERQGGLPEEDGLDVLLVPAPGAEAQAMARARALRASGQAVAVELAGLSGEALAAYARSLGARQVVYVHPDGPPEQAPPQTVPPPARAERLRLRVPGVTPIH